VTARVARLRSGDDRALIGPSSEPLAGRFSPLAGGQTR